MVGGVFGQTTPHFPLYIVEALLVEAVFARAGGRSPVVNGAHRRRADRHDRPRGRVGLVAHLDADPVERRRCCPRPPIAGLITAVAAGAVGGFIGGSLTGRSGVLISREDGRRLVSADRRAALVGGLALMAVIGWALPMSDQRPGARAGRAAGHRPAASSARWRPPSGSTRATPSRTPSS